MDYVTSSDGTPIALWRRGAGSPLLLVHGTTSNHTTWDQVAQGFEQSFTVHTIDRRGYGLSGDALDYSLEQEARDVAAVADWIGEPVNLLGHSFGGTCCLEAALRTQNLRSLILYELYFPGYEILDASMLAQLETLIKRNDREGALLMIYREVVGIPEKLLEEMRVQPTWADRVAAAPLLVRESHVERGYRPDLERLRTVQVPTLLLVGGNSRAFASEIARQLAATLPNGRIFTMLGQEHMAHRLVPDEFVAAVRTFILS